MTRRDPHDGIENIHQPAWVSKSIRRIERVGWARFLREQIEDPYIEWNWDPAEELANWEKRSERRAQAETEATMRRAGRHHDPRRQGDRLPMGGLPEDGEEHDEDRSG